MTYGRFVITLLSATMVAFFCGASLASAGVIASFENDTEGWTINTGENAAYAFNGFSTTTGVTNGAYSAIITGTAAPTYGQLLVSPSSTELTALLATTEEVSIDVATNAGAFDWGTQWTAVINNGDLGYTSLDGSTFTGFVGPGSSGHLTWSVTPAQRATLAASAAASSVIFQVGGGGAGTMYVDNIRLTTIPEPAALCLLVTGAVMITRRRTR